MKYPRQGENYLHKGNETLENSTSTVNLKQTYEPHTNSKQGSVYYYKTPSVNIGIVDWSKVDMVRAVPELSQLIQTHSEYAKEQRKNALLVTKSFFFFFEGMLTIINPNHMCCV